MTAKSNANKPQHARFIEAARQLGADKDEAAFKAKLAQLARQKPSAVSIPEVEQPRLPSVE